MSLLLSTNLQSEPELIERSQGGDREAFRQLYELHGPDVLRFLTRLIGETGLAEDALQDAFVGVYRALATLDPQRPLRPYLLRVARNVGISALRRVGRLKTLDLDDVAPISGEPTPPAQAERVELRAHVVAALGDLPAAQRAALLLRHDQGLTVRGVGSALGVSERTARTRLREATVLLARALRERGYVEEA